jgi:hypothetical protein
LAKPAKIGAAAAMAALSPLAKTVRSLVLAWAPGPLGEPAHQRVLGDRRHPAGRYRPHPLVPQRERGGGIVPAGIAADQPAEPRRMKQPEPEAGHAAERQAEIVDGGNLETIEDRDGVGRQAAEIIGAGRRAAGAVAPCVIAHHAAQAQEVGQLVVPHRHVGGERVGQHQPRQARIPVDPDRQRCVPGGDLETLAHAAMVSLAIRALTRGITSSAISRIDSRASAGSTQSWPA